MATTYTLSTANSWSDGSMTISHTTAGKVTVTVKLWRSDGGTSYNYDTSKNFHITINGTTYDHTVTKVAGTSGTSFSSSKTVTLSNSGTASVTVKVSGSIPGTTFKLNDTTKTYSITNGDRKTYTVTFNANGGSGAPSSQTKKHGINLTLSSVKPTRYGYTFEGWGTTANGQNVVYKPGGTYDYDDKITLYAIWSKSVTLSYNLNGGEGNAITYTTKIYNDTPSVTILVTSDIPTKVGYNFLGWDTNISATTPTYKVNGYNKVTISESTTLYAIWQLKTYQITYNGNGGTNVPSPQTKSYGINLKITTTVPIRSGYRFLGWSTSSTSKTPTYLSGSDFTSNADTVLYAVWEQLGIAYVNVNGTYKPGKVWVNDNGTWSLGIIFVNDYGTWMQGGI
jgi:uncharacterized repeat protein (TIGR02543 family)